MAISIRCRCGTLQGEFEPRDVYARATCYCRDCQAFAHTLGRGDVLNPRGGTDILAMLPAGLRLTAGADQLTCLSLSPRGVLRWHSACCNTPIANTPRDPKLPYVGLLATTAGSHLAALDEAVGPARAALNTESAQGHVERTRLLTTYGVVLILLGVIWARLRGRHRDNPFFEPGTRRPVADPRVLTKEERVRATPSRVA